MTENCSDYEGFGESKSFSLRAKKRKPLTDQMLYEDDSKEGETGQEFQSCIDQSIARQDLMAQVEPLQGLIHESRRIAN